MPETPFLPDNFLGRLEKSLSSGGPKKAIDALSKDFGDATFLTKHYQQAQAQLKKPIDGRDGDSRPVFGSLNRFLSKPIEPGQRHQHRQCLFLLGDAGMGKTSLLLLLKASQVMGISASPYTCALRRLSDTTPETLAKIPAPRRTILLLDALNEDPHAEPDLEKRLTELLEATRHFHRVIISCRTAYFCERRSTTHALGAFVSGAFRCPTLYLVPFNQAGKDKFLSRRFQRLKAPNRQAISDQLHALGSFRDRPLLLNHADDFVQTGGEKGNATAAYETILASWLERESKVAKLPKDRLWEVCTHFAHRLQKSSSRHRSDDLDGLDEIKQLGCQGRSLLRKVAGNEYRFTHVSFQEYLIARGLTRGMAPTGKQRLPATDLILTFLIECDNAATVWKALDLTRASFHRTELRGADFSRSLLERSDFSESKLHGTSFDSSILTEWDASQAAFQGGSFVGAKATFSNLRNAHFSGTSFANSTLADSSLAGAHFEECHFKHTLMASTDLCRAQFIKSTIEDCSFKGALLHETQFDNTTLRQARFDQAILSGARFSKATYDNVSLEGADLRGAEFDDGFFQAIKAGQITHWKTASWDPAVAKRLKLKQ